MFLGKRDHTAIGTLVERTTGYTMLLHLPDGYQAEQVGDVLSGQDPDAARGVARLV